MRTGLEFRSTVRRGVRAGRSTLVVHARHVDSPTLVGFVVSTAVGNAVRRNRVKRRLRHLVRPLLEQHPHGLHVVVRALPAAAAAGDELGADLANAWARCIHKLEQTS